MDALGYYTLLEPIGTGAWGAVYRARDTRLGRTVAVKLVPPTIAHDPAARSRLLTAARAASRLSHPSIASLYEIGEDGEHLFLVFEYASGETLRASTAGRAMNVRRALIIAAEVADALAEGHAAGIVHGDIRPENIVITPAGRAKLLDFGLASCTSGGLARAHAAQGVDDGLSMAVAPYLSPEQMLGAGADHRTDIFSLGTVLYEMVTGRSPFTASDAGAIALRVVQLTPPAPSTLNAAVPAELDEIVRRTLSKSLDARVDNAAALAADLRRVAANLESDLGARAFEEPIAGRSSRRWAIPLLVCAFVVVGVAWFGRTSMVDRWRQVFGAPPAPILVVAPFGVASNGDTAAYFGEGVAEDLVVRLAQIDGLRVRGQTEASRGGSPTARALAQSTNAAAVLTGTVEAIGDRLTLDLQLIAASDGRAIWSGRLTRPVANLLALETEAAEQIAGRFGLNVQATAERTRTASRTIDRAAYESYFQARRAAFRRNRPQSIARYLQAVNQDPGLAEAHAGLAEALYLDGLERGSLDGPGVLDSIQRAAASAAAIDPELPQVQIALGAAAPGLVAALTAFGRAIDLAPSLTDGYVRAAEAIAALDPARAAELYDIALHLDPFCDVRDGLAVAYARMGLFDRADAEMVRRRKSATEEGLQASATQAVVALIRQRPGEALERMPASTSDMPLSFLIFARAARAAGRVDRAFEIAAPIAARYPAACLPQIVAAALTSERDARASARLALQRWTGESGPVSTTGASASCAALAFAGSGDGENAALWLRRIAADEATLDVWLREGETGSERAALDGGWYPWDKVRHHPSMATARAELDRAYARRVRQIEPILNGLREPSNRQP